jgi:hypothetical protein
MPTKKIEASGIELGIHTLIKPDSPSIGDLKSQLEAKEAVIACLQEDVQKLLYETEDKNLEIAKQALEIQQLRRQQSHALTMDDVRGPFNVDAYGHDTNMLVDNDVIENVVATVTAGALEDIHTSVHKRASIALLLPSPTVQSLNTDGTQDSLSFLVFSMVNDFPAPLEPTSQIQDPSDLNEIIQLREDNKVLIKHISKMTKQYY